MEERKLNEKESLELIARMIDRTRSRLCLNDGRICLLWGYTSVAVAALVWAVGSLAPHPGWNFLWFLIWIVGGTFSARMKRAGETGARTYVDRLTAGLWSIVGWCTLLLVALCLGFMLVRGADCWAVMLVFGLLVVGIATAMQGVIIAEKCLVAGGALGMTAGAFVLCCLVAGVPLLAGWVIPLFMVTFVVMLIVPGHLLNAKRKNSYV